MPGAAIIDYVTHSFTLNTGEVVTITGPVYHQAFDFQTVQLLGHLERAVNLSDNIDIVLVNSIPAVAIVLAIGLTVTGIAYWYLKRPSQNPDG